MITEIENYIRSIDAALRAMRLSRVDNETLRQYSRALRHVDRALDTLRADQDKPRIVSFLVENGRILKVLKCPADVYFRYEHTQVDEPKPVVVIEVLGGVATVKSCPDGIEVNIIDHDVRPECRICGSANVYPDSETDLCAECIVDKERRS